MTSKKSLQEVLEMAIKDLQARLYEPNQRPSTVTLSPDLVREARENGWQGESLLLPEILPDRVNQGSYGAIRLHIDSSLILTEFVVEDSMSNKWVFLYQGDPENRLYMQRTLTSEPTMLIIGEQFEWPGIPGLPRTKRVS